MSECKSTKEGNPYPNYPLFSDLEGFEKEVEFIRRNIFNPYRNEKFYTKSGILTLPRGVIFTGNYSGIGVLAHALINEFKKGADGDNSTKSFFKQMFKRDPLKCPQVIYKFISQGSSEKGKKQFEEISKEMGSKSSSFFFVWTDDISTLAKKLLTDEKFRLKFQCSINLDVKKRHTILTYLTRQFGSELSASFDLTLAKVAEKCELDDSKGLWSICRIVYENWILDKMDGKSRSITDQDWELALEMTKKEGVKIEDKGVEVKMEMEIEGLESDLGKMEITQKLEKEVEDLLLGHEQNILGSNYLKLAGASNASKALINVQKLEMGATSNGPTIEEIVWDDKDIEKSKTEKQENQTKSKKQQKKIAALFS